MLEDWKVRCALHLLLDALHIGSAKPTKPELHGETR